MKNICKMTARLFRRATFYQYNRHLNCSSSLYHYSSSPVVNPTLLKLRSGISLSDIDATLLDISTLSSENSYTALTLILGGIQSQKYPLQILSNQKFIEQTLRHPQLFIDSKVFLAKVFRDALKDVSDSRRIEQYVVTIYKLYIECFKQLQKIEDKQRHTLYSRALDKHYADFFVTYLYKYYSEELKLKDLQKCIDVYHSYNQEIQQKLSQLKSKIGAKATDITQSQKKQALRIVQVFAENLIFTIRASAQILITTNNTSQYNQLSAKICQESEKCIQFYQMLKQLTGYQFKLQQELRVSHTNITSYLQMLTIAKKGSQEEKSNLPEMLNQYTCRNYEQLVQDLQAKLSLQTSATKALDIFKEILNMRVQLLYNKEQLSQQQLSQKVVSQMETIVRKIKDEAIRKVCGEFVQLLKQRVHQIVHSIGVTIGKVSVSSSEKQ